VAGVRQQDALGLRHETDCDTVRLIMKLNKRPEEPTATSPDVPGTIQIGNLFPWLAQLVPATPTPVPARPTAGDLKRAA